jgi:RNA polymerase sigma-70 factor, ECF subfamily
MAFNDEELIVLFAAGVEEAFELLYERHRHGIYRFAMACLQQPEDAEDVVQEVFVRMAQAAPRYQPSGRFQAWIYQIAANRIRSFARARSARRELSGESWETASAALRSAENVEQRTLLRDLISKALLALPDTQRMVLVLKEIEGLPCDAIARTLELSCENVRVLLHRARKQLGARFAGPTAEVEQ